MKIRPISLLERFRVALYELFNKRAAIIMDIIDAITADGDKYSSPTELALSRHFRRKYNSITKAIDAFSEVEWQEIMRLMREYSGILQPDKFAKCIVDCTSEKRQFSVKLPDRKFVHDSNPTPGNKPIAIGHEYSVLAQITGDKHWVIPLDAKRVTSAEKGNEVGVQQLLDYTADETKCSGVLGIGDSLYGSQKCRQLATEADEKLAYLFRLKRNRTLYEQVENSVQLMKGRKRCYGDTFHLSKDGRRPADHSLNTTMTTAKGKTYQVHLECWEDLLLRGTRSFQSYKYPLRIIMATVTNQDGKQVFTKPLCLAIQGSQRTKLSILEIYQSYVARYDIEHFFRYGKQRLLFNALQTVDLPHAENWHRLCLLAYFQLFLARHEISVNATPWGKYLPEYKNHQPDESATPSMTQRGMSALLEKIGTPAPHPKKRGLSFGRKLGETQPSLDASKIILQ